MSITIQSQQIIELKNTVSNLVARVANLSNQVNALTTALKINNTTVYINNDPAYISDLVTNQSIRAQWVYFIKENCENSKTDKIKIGVTDCLQNKLNNLQKGNADQLTIEAYIRTHDMHQLKISLHEHLEYYMYCDDWFEVSFDELDIFLNHYRDTGEFMDWNHEETDSE
jgi:hypothetical protein